MAIEWCDETWNPVVGCTPVSAGCANCYAATMTKRFAAIGHSNYAGLHDGEHFNGVVRCLPERFQTPARWRKPRRIFVNSMSDLFHPEVPDEFIRLVFAVMAAAPQHEFIVLTKRARRMSLWHSGDAPATLTGLPNLWTGVSVEDQETADVRIRELQWVEYNRLASIEPLLGFVELSKRHLEILGWVIIGCESGPNRRPCKLEWVRAIIRQCDAAHVPVFVKQLNLTGRVSRNPADWPQDLRRRERPGTKSSTKGTVRCP